MKRQILTLCAWALAIMGSFGFGYYLAGFSKNHSKGMSHPLPLARPPSVTAASIIHEGTPSEPKVNMLTAEAARLRTFEVLAQPNRIERLRQLCEMLTAITPENWREVKNAFGVQTRTEGRWQVNEWNLMLERVGEVAGPAAIQDAFEEGTPSAESRARPLMIGFASAHPKAALDWFDGQPTEIQQRLFNHLVSGVGRSQPEQALALLKEQPRNLWEANVPSVIDGAIQLGGFRRAEALYAAVRDRHDIPQFRKASVLHELANRQVTIGTDRNDPTRTLDWFERHVADSDPKSTEKVVTYAAKTSPSKTFQWLEANSERMPPDQVTAAYSTVARMWQAKAPAEFALWVQSNADHPRHEIMTSVGAPLGQ